MTRRLGALLGALVVLMLWASPAAAHPLGNFTINRFTELRFDEDGARIHYVIDMAEIPTFQELEGIGAEPTGAALGAYARSQGERLGSQLRLAADGDKVALRLRSATARLSDGQGGLDVMRVDLFYSAQLPFGETVVTYSDGNFDGRLGWREVVAGATNGGRGIERSSVPSESISDALRSYPKNLLSEPPAVEGATVTLAPGAIGAPAAPVAQLPDAAPDLVGDWFTSLVSRDLSIGFVLLALVAALGAGALHALGPGHGKTVMAAYLVGGEGRARHALAVGVAVSLMHTVSVIGLGLITLWASHLVPPETVLPWLSLLSGAVVLGLGLWLVFTRGRALLTLSQTTVHAHVDKPAAIEPVYALAGAPSAVLNHSHSVAQSSHEHAHALHSHSRAAHSHSHHGHSHHDHAPPEGVALFSARGLAAVGLSGGLLPSPSALVVLLGAVALGRTAFGLVLVAAFSIGLAAALTAVGLLVLKARDSARSRLSGRAGAWLPFASAALIVVVGLVLTGRAAAGL
jgi:ABC-type nickel/cobalt efflux system permease component RcnA